MELRPAPVKQTNSLASISDDSPQRGLHRVKPGSRLIRAYVSFSRVQTLGGEADLLVRLAMRGDTTRRSTSVTPFAPEWMRDGAMKRPGAAPRFYAEAWAKPRDDDAA